MFTRRQAGTTTTADPPTEVDQRTTDDRAAERSDLERREGRFTRDRPGVAADTMTALRARQRARFGGFSWGADLLGWLAAAGLAAILAGIVAAAGAALGITDSTDEIGWGGGIALLAVLFVSYVAGGYAAGRMSRFDGARQGLGVWLWGIVIAGAIALLAVAAGSDYNVLDQLNLPRIPAHEGTLTSNGAIFLIVGVAASLVGAVLGGTLGARWHRRVDRHVVETTT
jgi:hypothetical protein